MSKSGTEMVYDPSRFENNAYQLTNGEISVTLTCPVLPCAAARCNEVFPLMSRALILAPFKSRNSADMTDLKNKTPMMTERLFSFFILRGSR
jgi:hypothetical protein